MMLGKTVRSLRPPALIGRKYSNDTYQYLQQSKVPTDVFQKSLPRLPIPKLEKTCDRYLATQRALQDEQTFEATAKAVQAFLANQGPQLDKRLRAQDKANKQTSYISPYWFDMYLSDRRPVAFTHNPGLSLADDPRPEFAKSTTRRAANLLISALRFHKSMKEGILLPDAFHMKPSETNTDSFWSKVKWMPKMIATPLAYAMQVYPLDMSQFANLLQSTRVPMKGKDVIERFPDSKHVLVLSKGCFYTFDVYDNNGDLFEPSYYLSCISQVATSKRSTPQGLGVLTSTDRDAWAEARLHLLNLGNSEALKAVDSALFAICLDDHWEAKNDNNEEIVTELCCGSVPENRWFDKSFSMIFSKNGTVGINFEHAWGDGVAVMRFFDDILNDSARNSFIVGDTQTTQQVNVQEITFNIDEQIKAAIVKAKAEHLERLNSVEFKAYQRLGFGKNQCKKAKVGPDAVMQLAFQIAHLRLYEGKFGPTYESCSTAIFRHGRTETVRPLTAEMKQCALAFYGGKDVSHKELLARLQACSKAHMEMTKLAAQGQGWDRHLFALRKIAEQDNQQSLPDLFLDPAYKHVNNIILSTSTLSSTNFGVGGFCPVTPNGYGLGYQIRDEDLGVCASVFREHTSSSDMITALDDTFKEIANVVHQSLSDSDKL